MRRIFSSTSSDSTWSSERSTHSDSTASISAAASRTSWRIEHGINNRVTADGLVGLLRLIAEERAFTPELSREMLDILHGQQFRSGIPAGLPREVRVAHKTGDISTVAHDAGVVYLPGRKPYVIAVLTEWAPTATGRSTTIAEVSYIAYAALIAERADVD